MRHEEQEYMEPRPAHVLNVGELDRLRTQVAAAEREIASGKSREQDVKALRRQLETAELSARQAMTGQQRTGAPARNLCLNGPGRPVTVFEAAGSPSQPGDEIVWDDSGTMAQNVSSFARAEGRVTANARREPEYAEPVKYWE